MRTIFLTISVVVAALLLQVGCASSVCTPGATQTCFGPGACSGAQQCQSNGGAWGACVCATTGGGGGSQGGGAGGGGGALDAGFDAGVDAGVDAGFDAGVPDAGQCVPSCTQDVDCQNSCPIAMTGSNCCDTMSGMCFVSPNSTCPMPPDSGMTGPY